jgi:hypothetical protein
MIISYPDGIISATTILSISEPNHVSVMASKLTWLDTMKSFIDVVLFLTSKKNNFQVSAFLDEFSLLLQSSTAMSEEVIITGDLNFHLAYPDGIISATTILSISEPNHVSVMASKLTWLDTMKSFIDVVLFLTDLLLRVHKVKCLNKTHTQTLNS